MRVLALQPPPAIALFDLVCAMVRIVDLELSKARRSGLAGLLEHRGWRLPVDPHRTSVVRSTSDTPPRRVLVTGTLNPNSLQPNLQQILELVDESGRR